ncbi:MAG: two-component sensor histidine kinase [Clostridia bacterium]|nr:two-component sensor histidine kinase [Clostridia bacterium]
MRNENKKQRLSINLQIFISMIALTLVIIMLIWAFQMLFLKTIFESVKESSIEKASVDIAENIDSDDLNAYIARKTEEYDVSASVFKIIGQNSFENIYADENSTIITYEGNEEILSSWFNSAAQDKSYVYVPIKSSDELVYVRTVKIPIDPAIPDGEGVWYLVVLNTDIAPPAGTVIAIRNMLAIFSVVAIVASTIVSYALSRSISLPLSKMSKKAKSLTLYDYDVKFEEKGPREVSELATSLNSATAELKKLNDTQKELIANISHDLRTPLTMISGYSEVMRDFPDERSPENMQIIIDETARLNSLVNDLLTVSKLQSGTQIMDLKVISLTRVVEDTVKRYEKLLEHKEYKIFFESDGEVFVNADETRLLQVVYNLINNAINYTGEDKTVIVRQEIKGDVVRISVVDSGEGISEENLPLIWDRYYKVDKVHKRAVLGTGLGLSIVKNILLLHGSRFGVSSEVGKGSTFWFEFKVEKNG